MTQGITFTAMVRVYRAGNSLWNAWVAYRANRTWANLRALIGEILNFASEVNAAAPALAPAAAAALLAAAVALQTTVRQLQFTYPFLVM